MVAIVTNRSKVIIHDIVAITLAWFLAVAARFNLALPPQDIIDACLMAFPFVLVIQALVARHFGLYKGLWRFASLPDLWNIIRAAGLGALSIALTLFVVNRLAGIPRTTLLLYPLFLVFFLGGPRLMYRLWKDGSLQFRHIAAGQRVIIVGAGSGGEKVSRDMLRDGGYIPVGFVDDRTDLVKRRIHGIPVLGRIEELPALAERFDIDQIIIAIPSATQAQMRYVVDVCERAQRQFQTLPRLKDIVGGQSRLSEVRNVAIEDLLSREKIELDWQAIQAKLVGRSVLITGGAGSIGSEICRQVARLGVTKLIVFDQSEFGLYQIERELRDAYPHLDIHFVLGDVCDETAVEQVFDVHSPRLVFHAAAYKHVPILEHQVRAAVRNNILGTQTVASVAARSACESFILISTDKAVEPSSVMGATKRFAEMLCERQNRSTTETRFVTVRFGNVLGSAGSVVPLFREQIKAGGPVTVTHPEATRYFMTIPEATQLILQAAAVGSGGEIFVLNMGEPVRISYLAEQLIRLAGKVPGRDIAIVYSGLRPGEKLNEELFNAHEDLTSTEHDKLFLAAQGKQDNTAVGVFLEQLRETCEMAADVELRTILNDACRSDTNEPASAAVVHLERSKQ